MFRMNVRAFCMVFALASTAALAAPKKGDPEKGKEVFQQCTPCHNADSNEKKMGPAIIAFRYGFPRAAFTEDSLTGEATGFRLPIGGSAWTRGYQYSMANNRLLGTTLPGDPAGTFSARYQYDDHGNIKRMPHFANLADPNAPAVNSRRARRIASYSLSTDANVSATRGERGWRVRKAEFGRSAGAQQVLQPGAPGVTTAEGRRAGSKH